MLFKCHPSVSFAGFSFKNIFESFLDSDSQIFEKPASAVVSCYQLYKFSFQHPVAKIIIQTRQNWVETSLNRNLLAIILLQEKPKRKCWKLQNYSKNLNHKRFNFLDSTRLDLRNASDKCTMHRKRRRQKNYRQHAELWTQKWLGMNLITAPALNQHQRWILMERRKEEDFTIEKKSFMN